MKCEGSSEGFRGMWNLTFDGKLACLNKLFLLLVIFSGFETTGLSLDRDPPFGPPTLAPYLEPIKYNTTVFLGQTCYLPCVVKHLGDKTVSWIRKKDLHILTSGLQVYTNDKRVSLLREGKLLNSWTLKIASIRQIDEGNYECQINSEPKMTTTLNLIVLSNDEDPGGNGALALGMLDSPYHQKDDHRSKGYYEAKILGPSLMELEAGEAANITCIISHGNSLPPNVTWFLNEIPIQSARGGFSVDTEKSSQSTTSQLIILKVDKRFDEGKYSCGGMSVYPDSIVLKVLPHHHRHSSNFRDRSKSSSYPMLHRFWKPSSFFIYLTLLNELQNLLFT